MSGGWFVGGLQMLCPWDKLQRHTADRCFALLSNFSSSVTAFLLFIQLITAGYSL